MENGGEGSSTQPWTAIRRNITRANSGAKSDTAFYHFMNVEVFSSGLRIQCVDHQGNVFDEVIKGTPGTGTSGLNRGGENPYTKKTFEKGRIVPNPWTPPGKIQLQGSDRFLKPVSVKIFNLAGKNIFGTHVPPAGFFWDGRDNFGKILAAGHYWVQYSAGNRSFSRKLLLMK